MNTTGRGASCAVSTQRSFRTRLLIGAFVAAATSVSSAASAQGQAEQAPPLEEVIVSGFRMSLQQAAEIKREADVVADVISAEDIGKFPDQNLADSLQRITGIQITRTHGEGSRVSVRGLSPDFTQTLYNGRVLTSPSGGRSFEFATLASDFVNAVARRRISAMAAMGGPMGKSTPRSATISTTRSAFTLEGLNLDDSVLRTQNDAGYGRGYENICRRYTFGVRVKF